MTEQKKPAGSPTSSTQQKILTACHHCGATTGYYRKLHYTDVSYEYYDFADQPISNPSVTYISSARTIEEKTKYCSTCQKKIGIANVEEGR